MSKEENRPVLWGISTSMSYGAYVYIVRAITKKEAIDIAKSHMFGSDEEVDTVLKLNPKGKSKLLMWGGSCE